MIARARFRAAVALVVAGCWAMAPAARAEPEGGDAGFVIGFDDNAPPPMRHEIAPSLFFGAELELEFESENNYDLDDGDEDGISVFEPTATLALAYVPSPNFEALVSFELAREFLVADPSGEPTPPTRLELKEANLTFRDLAEGLSLRVGRQEFEDEREWLYDEELDAIRLFYGFGNFGIEASVSQEALFDKDLLNEHSRDDIANYFLLGRWFPDGDNDLVVEAYAFLRDDREPGGGQPVFLGLRSFGEANARIEYWAELAYVTGKGARNAAGRRPDIGAFGVDLGATYVFDAPLQPSVTLGFAHGSGDDDTGDGDGDGNFRQTGLEDNSDRFNGVASFEYYGAAFEPELSNMSIVTAGIGIRPSGRSSVDIVYHRYRQAEAADTIRDSNLDADPSGASRDLGSEIDLVIGYEPLPNVGIEAILGYFMPGDAFADDDDDAFFIGFETTFAF